MYMCEYKASPIIYIGIYTCMYINNTYEVTHRQEVHSSTNSNTAPCTTLNQ